MSDQNNNAKKGWYMHTSYNEAQQLRARVKAEVAKHANDDNLSAILAGEATSGEDANAKVASKKKANRQLYGILVGQIAIEDLISYLSSNHDDKGVEALDYIMSCHGAGTDDNKLDAADEEYKDIERKGIPDGATIEEANAVLTKMTNLFNMLNNDNTYQMSVERHSRNMILVVKNRSKEHKQELRMQKDKFDATVLGNIPQVAAKLDGIMRVVANTERAEELGAEPKLRLMMMQSGYSKEEVDVFFLKTKKNPGRAMHTTACPHCKIWHPGSFSNCYALTISKGKTPEGWVKFSKEQQERILQRAEGIKPGCTKDFEGQAARQ
jgi:hypothetical protein